MPREVSIRFNSADKLTWEPVSDGHMQQAMDDPIDQAIIVDRAMSDHMENEEWLREIQHETWSRIDGFHAGDVKEAHKMDDPIDGVTVVDPIALFLYSMEDDEWVYVAHIIYEAEFRCFLFRHRKEKVNAG